MHFIRDIYYSGYLVTWSKYNNTSWVSFGVKHVFDWFWVERHWIRFWGKRMIFWLRNISNSWILVLKRPDIPWFFFWSQKCFIWNLFEFVELRHWIRFWGLRMNLIRDVSNFWLAVNSDVVLIYVTSLVWGRKCFCRLSLIEVLD